MRDQNELYHYGVLGMKWGIRKAERRGESYTYKSHGQKKWAKKMDKARATGNMSKIAKANQKLELFKERDRARESYARFLSKGEAFAATLLGGTMYKSLRASGMNVAPSAATAKLVSMLATVPAE